MTEDMPLDVRQDRRELAGDVQAAEDRKKQVWIAYPARLFIEGQEVQHVQPRFAKKHKTGQYHNYDSEHVTVNAHLGYLKIIQTNNTS